MTSTQRFELLEHLGSGGFAHTYRARVLDEDLIEHCGASEVALKIPLNSKKERDLEQDYMMNVTVRRVIEALEAESVNIVRTLCVTAFRDQLVMVMEYVPQGSLRRRLGNIGRQKPLPVDEAVRIALGVLAGLRVIHEAHVFHRDIKPENILMAGETPKIADLGIARMLQSDELASTTTGTIYYMSPEILSDKGASFTSDIWSLGVTLYEMLAGRLPFGQLGTPIGTMVDLIRDTKQSPVNSLREDVPQELSDIVDRALQKDPARRFSGAAQMHEALSGLGRTDDETIRREMMAIRQLSSSGQSGTVEEKLHKLIARHPEDPRAYQYVGEYYNLCQRYAEAISMFKRGLKLDGDNALLHWYLALAYQKRGRHAAATRHLKKAVDLNLDPSLREHAAHLLRALGGSA